MLFLVTFLISGKPIDWAYKFSCLPFDKQMRSLQRKMKDFQNLYIVDSKSLLIKNYSTRFREYKTEKTTTNQ